MKCICGLCMAFENFLGLFLFFLRSLIPKKSSGMQKPYVWLVTPSTKNQHKNSILVHSGIHRRSISRQFENFYENEPFVYWFAYNSWHHHLIQFICMYKSMYFLTHGVFSFRMSNNNLQSLIYHMVQKMRNCIQDGGKQHFE